MPVAFALDGCNRDAIAHSAATGEAKSENVSASRVTIPENHYGRVKPFEADQWLTNDGLALIATREIAASGHRHRPCSMPFRHPQPDGMTLSLVNPCKRTDV
jgi:putative transposase